MESKEDAMVTLAGTDPDTDELAHAPIESDNITIADNKKAGVYELRINGQTAAGLLYTATARRVTIRSTAVFREFRGRGIAAKLLGGVLDMLRADGRAATLTCPFARAFVRSHPEYADVVDTLIPNAAHLHLHETSSTSIDL